ncbi:hypothetical protein NUW54_g8154 [Trametes sanguinea]|uniref:Uncharacterized protein n=1 Tax=Trametes sanguinea TaxID=158606 RepID=A0ACC1PHA4_9APHY|nr:hypothetical protein NUW54_g8154 [Trametes sanguinea]
MSSCTTPASSDDACPHHVHVNPSRLDNLFRSFLVLAQHMEAMLPQLEQLDCLKCERCLSLADVVHANTEVAQESQACVHTPVTSPTAALASEMPFTLPDFSAGCIMPTTREEHAYIQMYIEACRALETHCVDPLLRELELTSLPYEQELTYINDPSGDEHLDFDHPLAANVPITAGSALVTVPDVTPRDDYVVDLYGNSGNISPKFTISN